MSHKFYSPSANVWITAIPKCGLHTVGMSIIYLEDDNFKIAPTKLQEKYNPASFNIYKYTKRRSGRGRRGNSSSIAVVRNPFARTLSMFSNKGNNLFKHINNDDWGTYEHFILFLKKIENRQHDRSRPNHHFASMTKQLKIPSRYDEIFCIENMHEYYEYLKNRLHNNERGKQVLDNLSKSNLTLNTSDSIQKYAHYLTPEAQKKIVERYKSDFEVLKYSKKVSDIKKPRSK